MKHVTKKRLLCLLLSLALIMLSACTERAANESSADGSADIAGSDESKEDFEWVAGIDGAGGKYRGKSFKVVSVASELFYDVSENPLARSVMKRNGLLEQYLGISLMCTEKTAKEIESGVKLALDSGTQYADLICAPLSVMSRLAAEGYLENLYSLPYVDFGAGYMEKSVLDSQTVSNTLYMYSGELTHSTNASVGLFYNKALVNAAFGDPVQLVKDGTFTWSALSSMIQAVSETGAIGIDSLLDDDELATAIYGSSGNGFVAAGSGKAAQPVFNEEAAQTAASIINGIFRNADYCSNYDEGTAVNAFKTGKIGFVAAYLGSVSLFDGCESEWGLLPLPKHSTAQSEYSSFVGANALAVGVPRGCTDSAFSGFVLNALFAASETTLEQALKTTYINYHFWSNDAAVMLNCIAETKRFDLGVIYSSEQAVANIGTALILKEGASVSNEARNSFLSFTSGLFY